MKKSFLFMSLLLGLFVSVFALTACSSDDDDNNDGANPLLGTWRWTSSGGAIEEYTFFSDNSVVFKIYQAGSSVADERETSYGTYSVKGNKLTMKLDYWNAAETVTFVITGNSAKLTYPDGSTDTWTKYK